MGIVMVDFKSGLILLLLVFSYILPGCNSAESNEPNNEFDQEEIINQLTQQLNESNKRIEQLSELMDESNQSSQMLQFQIDILQISLDLEKNKIPYCKVFPIILLYQNYKIQSILLNNYLLRQTQ